MPAPPRPLPTPVQLKRDALKPDPDLRRERLAVPQHDLLVGFLMGWWKAELHACS